MQMTVAEYFAGIGLVRLGLERQGWRIVFANDIDPDKYKMYSSYFEDDSDVYEVEDVHDVEAADVPTSLLATASFPCIDLSLAGNRAGLNGRYSSALWGFLNIIENMKERRPPLIMLENVLGWASSNGGQDFRESIAALNELGYACDAFVLNAQHFAPQSRRRLFVIGADVPTKREGFFEEFRARSSHLHTKRLLETVWASRDLSWFVLDLPSPPPLKHNLHEVVEKLPPDDERWWPEERKEHLISQMHPRHFRRVEEMLQADGLSYATVYKRVRKGQTRAEVRNDGVAGCLRTPSGGSSKQILVEADEGTVRIRWMTAREYARLQGVPDSYPIEVSFIDALWGFGDAVCVPAISWIAEYGLHPLAQQLEDDSD